MIIPIVARTAIIKGFKTGSLQPPVHLFVLGMSYKKEQ